jgi:hypothetical protein
MAQYLDILTKVRTGTHRIISYRGGKNATRYRLQRLHPERGWLETPCAEGAARRASKELAGKFHPSFGLIVFT